MSDGRSMPLVSCLVEADVCGGIAQVVLRQTFVNESDDPLQATYQCPLPPDAAVGGYAFVLGSRRIVGEIDRREAARERFEEAVIEGRTASLLEQDRSSLFTQELGNIPPRTQVTCEVSLDQKLRWSDEGRWEWRFPTVVAPRYMGGAGTVLDQSRLEVDVGPGGTRARINLRLRINDQLLTGQPKSLTHAILCRMDHGAFEVELDQAGGVEMDRDIVVSWSVAQPSVGTAVQTARAELPAGSVQPAAFGLVTVTPPVAGLHAHSVPRDLVLLLDTSGSMGGRPLDMAKEVATGLVDSLGSEDQLEMIEFSNEPTRWSPEPCSCNDKAKAEAIRWIQRLRASGGTEMRSAVLEAIRSRRSDAQRQVILITDGLIGFEKDVIASIRQSMPDNTRIHCVGISSAPNRSLTEMLARSSGGAEILVALDDDLRQACARVLSRTAQPLVTHLRLSGSALLEAPGGISDLLVGHPALIPVRLWPEGGELIVNGHSSAGPWEVRTVVSPVSARDNHPMLARLFAREMVERLELDACSGQIVDAEIERIGMQFQIATRLTSWVAVSEEPTVDPKSPIRRVRVPQALPYGMSVEGLGLRSRGALPRVFRHAGLIRYSPVSSQMAKRRSVTGDASQGLTLKGAIIALLDGCLVVEIALDRELDWEPVGVGASFARRARIDTDSTTAPGCYPPGTRLRLVLKGVPKRIARGDIDEIDIHSGPNVPSLRLRF